MSSGRTSDISEWYGKQYSEAVGLDKVEGGSRFKRFVRQFPQSSHESNPFPITGRARMSNFLKLKLRYPLGNLGYACLVMSARTGSGRANYAYAYWRRGHEREDPEYICVSPTFDSRDGEYRQRFVRYPAFAGNFDSIAGKLSPFEDAVLAMTGSGALRLDARAYPEEAAEGVTNTADRLRLPITALAVALALDLFAFKGGALMAHTSKAYALLLGAVAEKAPALIEASMALSTPISLTGGFRRGEPDEDIVQCGQKIVPMFVREVVQAADYNLAAWRELAVSQLAGDLVLNYVAPGFAFYNQWAYIEGADAALFENAAMDERYTRGEAIGEALRSLRESRRALSAPAVLPNYHTEALSTQLYESLEYAQSYLLVSPIALVHTMEDVGWALRSLSTYARRAPVALSAAQNAFASADTAARHLFEFAYGAHCLHTKLGVAHTDLHGNNLTFYVWGLADKPPGAAGVAAGLYYDDPLVAYVAGARGEADTYVFPAAGDSGCIVDYSRCILGPAYRPRLEEGRSPRYATNFYRDQVNRVMRTFFRYAPSFTERHQEAIKAAVLANFESAFPVLCAVDFIAIGRNVGAALKEAVSEGGDGQDVRPFNVAQAAFDLAARLEEKAQEIFITGLHDLAESAGARRMMRTPDFPGPALFEGVFGEWLFPRWAQREPRRLKTAQFMDCWNYQNGLRHSGADYAKYPPWARFDEIERHLGEYRMVDLFERGVEPFLESLQPSARVEVIAERLRTAQENLDGAPTSAKSSWIDE